jgi:hypothetical protein
MVRIFIFSYYKTYHSVETSSRYYCVVIQSTCNFSFGLFCFLRSHMPPMSAILAIGQGSKPPKLEKPYSGDACDFVAISMAG